MTRANVSAFERPARLATAALACALLAGAAEAGDNALCHWASGAGKYNLVYVGDAGFQNHLAHHPNDKPLPTWWRDADGDGFGNPAVSLQQCDQPPGYVGNSGDCNDAASSCTSACATDTDGDLRADCLDRCADNDRDVFGLDASGTIVGAGSIPVGACTTDGATPCDLGPACLGPDCDDAASSCTTLCSNADGDARNDCRDRCLDADGDGYGSDNSAAVVGAGTTAVGGCTTNGSTPCALGPACLGPDCDDGDANVNPAATEVCDEIDNDCDGLVDEGVTTTYYRDADGDGYGDASLPQEACTQPSGHVGNDDDCNDADAAIHPGAAEVCDAVDNDCDGQIDEGGVCTEKVVFVSSLTYDGNFGAGQMVRGYLDADQRCQDLANAVAALAGKTFKAWLSGRGDGFGCGGSICSGQDVIDRFTPNPGPYLLTTGTQVADSWADLTDGSLDHAIDRDENGNLFAGTKHVWTNTTTGGVSADIGTNCAAGPSPDVAGFGTWSCGAPSWTAGDCQFQSGRYGFADSAASNWTGGPSDNKACSQVSHLYCFEQ